MRKSPLIHSVDARILCNGTGVAGVKLHLYDNDRFLVFFGSDETMDRTVSGDNGEFKLNGSAADSGFLWFGSKAIEPMLSLDLTIEVPEVPTSNGAIAETSASNSEEQTTATANKMRPAANEHVDNAAVFEESSCPELVGVSLLVSTLIKISPIVQKILCFVLPQNLTNSEHAYKEDIELIDLEEC